MSEQLMPRNRWGLATSALALVLGLLLLLGVFVLTLSTFVNLPGQMQSPAGATLEGAGRILGLAVARVLLLFVMAFAASLLASKGIEFFTVSSGRSLR